MNFVAYSFNYDVTQILLGFLRPKVWEITRKRSWKTEKKIKTATWVDDYAIECLKSKWLKIWKLRDPEHPTRDKLDKCGNVIFCKKSTRLQSASKTPSVFIFPRPRPRTSSISGLSSRRRKF